MKYYICRIRERNGDKDYSSKFLFETKGDPQKYAHKVASTWRGYKERFDKEYLGYWHDFTLIYMDRVEEVPSEDFEVLKKYLSVL